MVHAARWGERTWWIVKMTVLRRRMANALNV